jgi:hypothetical protein
MSHCLPLLSGYEHYKIKIRDKESREEPHVTILYKTEKTWRFGLRSRKFLRGEDPSKLPPDVKDYVNKNIDILIGWWNQDYKDKV